MKKLFASLLALVLLLTCIPLGAVSVSAATSGKTGDCTWRLEGTHLIISGKGAMGDYWYEAKPWDNVVTKVTIKDGVTAIGASAFSGCRNLTSITIPDSVTTIGDNAFEWCEKLAKVTFGKNVKDIHYGAFYNCTALTSITIPDSVTTIGRGVFAYCENLKSVTIGKGFKEDISTYWGEGDDPLFYGCNKLTTISISKDNPYFSTVDNVLFNKKKTKLIFCPAGKSGAYTVPNTVTTIGECAFYSCDKLTSLTIPDSVKTIESGALTDCDNLKKVSLGKGVETIVVGCFNPVIYGTVFFSCSKLTTLTVSKSNPYFTAEEGVLFNKEKTELIVRAPGKTGCYVIPDGVTTIKKGAQLQSAVIPSSMKTIELDGLGTDLTKFYYTGSQKELAQKVKIDINYTKYYYSSIEQDPYDYVKEAIASWHYNTCQKHSYSNACDKTCNKCDWVRTTNHTYTNACDKTCNVCEAKRTIKHTYSNACDTKCNVCKAKRTIQHTYKVVATKKATPTADGKGKQVCSVCGYTATKTVTIHKANKISLSTTSYTYTGSVKKPTVTVKDAKGKTIPSKYYTVTYATGRKNVGTYKVTVKMKGNYSGTKTLTFKVLPAKTSISSLTAGSKKLTVKWAKKTTQVTGYQIQYSTSKSFSSAKSKTITKNSTVSTALTGLSAKKTYYVRIRTYKLVNGVKIYSGWSTAKSLKTK